MKIVNICDAKTRLSQWVDEAASGTDVVVSRDGNPVARITRLANKPVIRFGVLKGKLVVPGDFDAPLADEVVALFGPR